MKQFNTAVIGCGMISKNHFKALKNVENARCVVACDCKPERARQAAETYGIPRVETDYQKVLQDPDIDVVHLCLPHFLHAKVAIEAMEHGKHVLCEKPMALSPDDAEKMIAARDASGKALGICFQNRYNESSRYMRQLMDSGTLGRVLGARGSVVWKLNALGQGVGGGQHVRAGKLPVRKDCGVISPHHIGVADHTFRLLGPHGQHGDGSAQLLPDAQGAFQRKQVEGIGAGGGSQTLEAAGFLVDLHRGARGNLLHAHDHFHGIIPFMHLNALLLHFKA